VLHVQIIHQLVKSFNYMPRTLLLFDAFGAILFALGLAWGVNVLAFEEAGAGDGALIVLLLLGSGLVRALALGASDILAARCAQGVVADLRRRLSLHLLGGRLREPVNPGEAASLIMDQGEAIRMREVRFAPVRMAAMVAPFLVLLAVMAASLVAAAILLFTFVFFILVMILTGTAAAREADAQLDALTALSGLLEDRLQRLPIIRHFGAEERIARQIGQSSQELSRRTVAVLRKAFLSSAALEFFAALSVALVAVYCGFSLLGLLPFPNPEELTLAEAFFALALAPEFYLPLRRLAAAYHEKQMGEAADKALEPLLNDADDAVLHMAETHADLYAGLRVDGLSIAFDNRTIGPVNFAIGKAGLVALVGPTGSGKTSVLSAIAGQLVPSGGSITMPGVALPPAPEDVAWAAQRPLFLEGSLADNIALASPSASVGEVERVARRVGLGALIDARGMGFALTADGAGISGGERRRIGLARAILSQRPLILCDEPTADLDVKAAQDIAQMLVELAQDRALIVATHDPRIMDLAQKVVQL